ncbi:MAG: Hsp20/alpha crystallin family protein, partial [Verrucomicrobiales bacterium]
TRVVARPEEQAYVKPRYSVKSSEHSFELRVVMPGVRKEDVGVSLDESRLTVTGVPHREVPASWRSIYEELERATYRLALQLHRDIDEGAITATVEDGILTLVLPIVEAAKPRVIEVE